MSFETQSWPFVQAKYFTYVPLAQGRRRVRVIVIHDMEYPERLSAAEDVARYFQHPDTQSSAHICVDEDTIVQCVRDNNVAWAAPGCNNDGIQIELAGYSKQSRDEWLDQFSLATMQRAADATAQYCLKYDIPIKHLTNQELAAGEKGIIGHFQASEVYKKSDHSDPGPNFPWDAFMAFVETWWDVHHG